MEAKRVLAKQPYIPAQFQITPIAQFASSTQLWLI
jgi:hypothetical protein